jgi:hypothetical protein
MKFLECFFFIETLRMETRRKVNEDLRSHSLDGKFSWRCC